MRRTIGLSIACLPLLLLTIPSGAQAQAQTQAKEDAKKVLAFSGQVSGTILTPGRGPVQGASVAVVDGSDGEIHGSSTDEHGRYAIKELSSASYSVLVMDPGGNVLRKENVNVRPLFRNLVDFITEPAGSPQAHHHPDPIHPDEASAELGVTGRLVDTSGEPIPEAWVILTPEEETGSTLRARTDVEGKFRLLKVQAGHYKISAKALGQVPWSLGPIDISGKSVSIKLALLPFPLGHPEVLEDLLVPVDPATPAEFEKETAQPESATAPAAADGGTR